MPEYRAERLSQVTELLALLAERQYNGCAPIELSIGCVRNGIVENAEIVIKKAPPLVIEMLVHKEWQIDMQPDGAHIYRLMTKE